MPIGKKLMITGPVGIGKSTLAARLVERAFHEKLKVAGVLSPRIWENDETVGYNITDVGSGKTAPLALVEKKLSEYDLSENDFHYFTPDFFGGRSCRFHFLTSGFDLGNNILNKLKGEKEKFDVIIIDEIGFLELKGEGLFQAVSLLRDIGNFHGLIIVLTRDFLADKVVNMLHTPFDVIGIGDDWERNTINEIWRKYFIPLC